MNAAGVSLVEEETETADRPPPVSKPRSLAERQASGTMLLFIVMVASVAALPLSVMFLLW
jgi:hypothetical protein